MNSRRSISDELVQFDDVDITTIFNDVVMHEEDYEVVEINSDNNNAKSTTGN